MFNLSANIISNSRNISLGSFPTHATENLSVLAYRLTFNRSDLGAGAAVAFFTMLVLMIFAIGLLRR